jgi:hypothetical protein
MRVSLSGWFQATTFGGCAYLNWRLENFFYDVTMFVVVAHVHTRALCGVFSLLKRNFLPQVTITRSRGFERVLFDMQVVPR